MTHCTLVFVVAVVVALLGLLLGPAAAQESYCAVSSQNTMCKYGPDSRGPNCVNYKSVPADRVQVLRAHNELRNRVALGQEKRGLNSPQPSAANMRKLVWDDELEAIAQRWANQCVDDHDANRNTLDGTYCGQNEAWRASTAPLAAPNYTDPVESWYKEVDKRDGSLNTVPFQSSRGVGHYTQVVWAATTRVGCAAVDYTAPGRFRYQRLYFCNYKPGGNVVGLGTTMYEAGAPASKCPRGTRRDAIYPGLCANEFFF